MRSGSLVVLLVSVMLLPNIASPAHAITARGVLKRGEDYVHFDLSLTANITASAFNITKKWFKEDREAWRPRWNNWKYRWEETHKDWKGKWSDLVRGWKEWADRNIPSRIEWEREWKLEWGESWNPKWAEEWDKWEEWMQKWEAKWEGLKFEEIESIPEFMKSHFQEKVKEKFDELWNKHMNAPTLARCWTTPASQLGLKNALGNSLNKTLQWVYNSTDVYIKNFNLSIEATTNSAYKDSIYTTIGLYDLRESFDLYGVVTNNASGTFIRSQFRYLNVTEKVDGGKFGFPGWVFTPGKAMFLDLTVFSVPLEQWVSTFDSASDTTTFKLVKDINVTTPYGSIIIDPEMVLAAPGHATATGNVIAIASILPTDLVTEKLVTAATAVATVVFVGYYMTRKRRTLTLPTPQLARICRKGKLPPLGDMSPSVLAVEGPVT